VVHGQRALRNKQSGIEVRDQGVDAQAVALKPREPGDPVCFTQNKEFWASNGQRRSGGIVK
jgi:hypothetical protein